MKIAVSSYQVRPGCWSGTSLFEILDPPLFSAQKADAVLKRLRDNYIHTVYVPPNCTGYLQPMDINVNKTVKEF